MKWLGFVAALLIAMAGWGQEAPAAPLTLAQCLQLALEHQADVQIGQRAVVSAQARATKAASSYYPQIALANSNRLARAGAVAPISNSTTGLTVSQTFYDGGIREANVKGAKAGVTQSTAALQRTRQAVIFAVTRDYYALLRAAKLAEVQDARVTLLTEQRDQITTRVQAGDAAQVDSYPVEAQLANAQVDRLSAQNTVRTAALALQNTMGLEPREGFTVQDVPLPAPQEPAPLAQLLQTALTLRPDRQQTQAGTLAAKYGTQAAKIALAPRPVVTGDFSQPLLSGDRHSMTIAGGLAYNLFDGGAARADYRAAKSAQETAELQAQQLVNDIRTDVQTAYLDLQNARDRLAASALSVQAARRNADAQTERYRLGLAIPLDLLNAQVDLATAQSNEAQARYDYLTALAQLDFAVGTQGEPREDTQK